MVNLLVSIILSGFAITFTIELIALLLSWFLNKETVYNWLSLPLSFGAMFAFYNIQKNFFVLVPATAFITLILNKYINTPSVTSTRLKRL